MTDPTARRRETEAVWETIPGARPLFDIYGYWPSMHDAVVESVRWDAEEDALSIAFLYPGIAPSEGDWAGNLFSRFSMRWTGLWDWSLQMDENWIDGLAFTRVNERIVTELEGYQGITAGRIDASAVEVLDVREGAPPETSERDPT
jgi:hypothetical protein